MCNEKTEGFMDVQIGLLVKSKAGHDKNQIYVIVDEKSDGVFVADGRLKPVEKPKKKNRKHIQVIKVHVKDLVLKEQATLRNEDIRYALRLYKERLMNI